MFNSDREHCLNYDTVLHELTVIHSVFLLTSYDQC